MHGLFQEVLLCGDHVPWRCQRLDALSIHHIEVNVPCPVVGEFREGNGEACLFLRSGLYLHLPALVCLSVGQDGVSYFISAVYVREIESVVQLEPACGKVGRGDGHILIYMLHLVEGRMYGAVRGYQPVAAEVAVTRHVCTVVPSVCPEEASVLVLLGESLVHPVPDETSLEVRVLVYVLPLEVDGACGIAHGVCVFRRAYRAVAAVLSHLPEPVSSRILRHEHVRIPLEHGPFVAYRAVHCRLLAVA